MDGTAPRQSGHRPSDRAQVADGGGRLATESAHGHPGSRTSGHVGFHSGATHGGGRRTARALPPPAGDPETRSGSPAAATAVRPRSDAAAVDGPRSGGPRGDLRAQQVPDLHRVHEAQQQRRTGERPRAIPQLVLTLLCAGYACGASLGWGSERVALFMGDFGLSLAGLCAAFSCLWYAWTRKSIAFRPAWVLFGLSALVAAAGNAVWGWYELVLGEAVPRPSAADCCFLLFAPLAIVGLLVLAKRPSTRAGWVCLCLDSWLIGGSLLSLSWSLALAHTAYGTGGSVSRVALTLAYPLLDIALVSMVLALHLQRTGAQRSAINTVIGALTLTVLCDALFTSPLLREHYSSGQLLDAGWFAGSMLLAYAPWVARGGSAAAPDEEAEATAPARGSTPSGRSVPPPASGLAEAAHWEQGAGGAPGVRPIAGSLAALAPYLAAAVCTLGILYSSVMGRVIDRVMLITAGTVVLALVVRQGIMLLDNISLTQELAQKENHFRSLVQGSSDVIMIASATGVLRYVSPAAMGVYGRDGDQLVGSELSAFIHPDDLGRVLHELRRFLASAPQEEPSTRIECRFRHGAGHWLNVESTVNRYQSGLIFNSRDVTERVRLQAQLQHNASHDPLTDLPNRALFTERVRKALAGRRGGDSEHAVLYIDLDGFKAVNDTVGHQAGDELLVSAARRLQDSVRAGDTAARLGGDEFAVLILGDGNPSTHTSAERESRIHEIADRLRLTLSEPYRVEGTEVRVAASIGVAFAEPGISPTSLMRNADLAMYRAKQAGKARVKLYHPRMRGAEPQPAAAKCVPPAARSRSAARGNGDFDLLHQPVVELASGKVTAVTARPRWRPPKGAFSPPGVYVRADVLDAFEELPGLDRAVPQAGPGPSVAPLVPSQAGPEGRARRDRDHGGERGPAPDRDRRRDRHREWERARQWADGPARGPGRGDRRERAPEAGSRLLEQAVEQAAARHRVGFATPVAVRLPASRLMDQSLSLSAIERLLGRYELPMGALILELTGTDLLAPLDELELRLAALHRLGVGIALDGFGRGRADVSALRRLPVDILRLDRGLVGGVLDSSRERRITAGLLHIAGELGLSSVADGVDLPEQVLTLRALGCTHGQGAVFAGPLDERRLRQALARGAYALPEAGPGAFATPIASAGHPGSKYGADPARSPFSLLSPLPSLPSLSPATAESGPSAGTGTPERSGSPAGPGSPGASPYERGSPHASTAGHTSATGSAPAAAPAPAPAAAAGRGQASPCPEGAPDAHCSGASRAPESAEPQPGPHSASGRPQPPPGVLPCGEAAVTGEGRAPGAPSADQAEREAMSGPVDPGPHAETSVPRT